MLLYQVVVGDNLDYPERGLSCTVVKKTLEDAWVQLGHFLDYVFRDYRRGHITVIRSIDIDVDDRMVIARYERHGYEGCVSTRTLLIQELTVSE